MKEAEPQREPPRPAVRRSASQEINEPITPPDVRMTPGIPASPGRERIRRELLERALTETQDLFYQVFQIIPASVAIIRLQDEVLLDVNEQFLQLLSLSRDEAGGAMLEEIPALHGDGVERLLRQLDNQPVVQGVEVTLATASGERVMQASARRLVLRGEACALIVLLDVTAHKRAQQALVVAKRKAEESSRLRMAILTNITHEVRTPLTVILGFTAILRQGVRKEYQRFVDLIERSGRRLMLLLDAVIDLAQLEAGALDLHPEAFDVMESIWSVADQYESLAREKGVRLEITPSAERLTGRLDPRVFARVLSHLIDNAIKFTNEGVIRIHGCVDDEHVRVEVDDTGIGITDDFLPHVFDEFTQESTGLERTHQGVGLGLAVAQRLIEAAGGTIEVQSRKGEGSVFSLVLPRIGQAA